MARAKIEDERKEQILAAFEACVIRLGLAKTTLQKVADEVGLPRSLVRYFVGNRDDMVDLLIERMIERAEQNLENARPDGSAVVAPTLESLLDTLFTATFSDPTSNSIVGELWYLAERDETIRKRLTAMYGRILKLLITQMQAEEIGRNNEERKSLALALISLAYGQASFAFLGLKAPRANTLRLLAGTLIGDAGRR